MDISAKPRNYHAIDLAKFVMAIVVVAIHTEILGDCYNPVLIDLYNYFADAAVPFFFLASGFLLYRNTCNGQEELCGKLIPALCKHTEKIFKLYTRWYILYTPLAVFHFYTNDYSVIKSILVTIRGYLLIGKNYNSDMLWYLLSSVYALLFVALLVKLRFQLHSIMVSGGAVYLLGIFMTRFIRYDGTLPAPLLLLQTLLDLSLTNGRIFTGFLYIPLGMYLAKKDYSAKLGVALLIPGLIGNRFLTGLPGTVMLAVYTAAILIIVSRITLADSPVYAYLRRGSTIIYLLHMYVRTIYCFVLFGEHAYGPNIFIGVFSITLVLTALWLFVENKFQQQKKQSPV